MSAARTTSTAPVRYESRGPVAVVTMDRPDHCNARAMTEAGAKGAGT